MTALAVGLGVGAALVVAVWLTARRTGRKAAIADRDAETLRRVEAARKAAAKAAGRDPDEVLREHDGRWE